MIRLERDKSTYLIQLLKSVLFSYAPPEKPEDIDFKDIYSLARKHFLANMVYYAISKLKEKPDSELLKEWREEYLLGKMRNTIQKQELKMILKKLEENRIKNIPLKGFEIKGVYPSEDMRQMSDLDILISLEDRERAREILEGLGYTTMEFGKGKDDVYYKKPAMNIEIHNNLFDRSEEEMYHYFSKMSSMEKAKSKTEYSYEFSKEDTLIYGIVHLVKHFKNTGIGIRYIMDWWLYIDKYRESLNWEYIESSLKELNIYEFYKNIISLGDYWFGEREATELILQLEEYIVDSGIYGIDSNRYLNILTENSDDSSKSGKISTLKKYVFPKYSLMCERYPVLIGRRYLLPFYYVVRILEILLYRRRGKMRIIKEVVSKKMKYREKKNLYKNMGLKNKK